jgi:hypothetical protein
MTGRLPATRLACMRTTNLVFAFVIGLAVLSGCSFREAICSDGEYPVQAVNSTTGRARRANNRRPAM